MAETVRVEKLLNNGHGMGRLENGEVVFVPAALPDERWHVSRVERRKSVLIATSAERKRDSPVRVTPACPHNDHCGGCSLLHVARDAEIGLKVTYLKDTLRRIGGFAEVEVEAVSFPESGSRARGKFHVSPEGVVGFKGEASDLVTTIESCQVIPESVCQLLPMLRKGSKEMDFQGDIYFAVDASGEQPSFIFRGTFREGFHAETFGAKGIRFEHRGSGSTYSAGNPSVKHHWNGLSVNLNPNAFFQSNPASWPLFWQWVRRYREHFQPKCVWDVHAGAGFLSSGLEGTTLVATEPDGTAAKELSRALGAAGFHATVLHGTAEWAIRAKAAELAACDGALLDPPREGLSKPLRAWLREKGPRGLLYFSCDMGSFSRDLAALKSTYELVSPILAMNLNPGTLRLELAVLLERKA